MHTWTRRGLHELKTKTPTEHRNSFASKATTNLTLDVKQSKIGLEANLLAAQLTLRLIVLATHFRPIIISSSQLSLFLLACIHFRRANRLLPRQNFLPSCAIQCNSSGIQLNNSRPPLPFSTLRSSVPLPLHCELERQDRRAEKQINSAHWLFCSLDLEHS